MSDCGLVESKLFGDGFVTFPVSWGSENLFLRSSENSFVHAMMHFHNRMWRSDFDRSLSKNRTPTDCLIVILLNNSNFTIKLTANPRSPMFSHFMKSFSFHNGSNTNFNHLLLQHTGRIENTSCILGMVLHRQNEV